MDHPPGFVFSPNTSVDHGLDKEPPDGDGGDGFFQPNISFKERQWRIKTNSLPDHGWISCNNFVCTFYKIKWSINFGLEKSNIKWLLMSGNDH